MTASLLSGCGNKPLDGTETAMVIDGEEISLGLANYFLRTEQASTYYQMQSMMMYFSSDGKTFWGATGEDGVSYAETFKESEITNITNLVTLRKHADEYGVSLSDDENAKIAEVAKTFYDKNSEAMAMMGTTVENIEEALELKTIEVKIKAPMVADVDKNVSDDEAAQSTCTYVRLKKSNNEDEAAAEEENKAAKEQMEDILKQILDLKDPAEADLSELAKAANENAYSASYNYNQDAYDDENNVLDAAVKEVLPNLKDGEVYDKVIEGENYYFIIRMDKYFDRDKTDSKKESIIGERENTLYTDMLTEWTDGIKADVKACWDKLEVSDTDIFTLVTA